MNAELREAVEAVDFCVDREKSVSWFNWQTIRQALRDQEADIARLQNVADGNAELYQHELLRTQNAEALLRECRQMLPDYCEKLVARITAHLGGENNG
jgi:endonuclease/exonuclease/phosphatase family metal-dependent hydrolase